MPDTVSVLQQTNFTWIDWVIVIVYPMISVVIAFLALLTGVSAVLGLEPVQKVIGINVPIARIGLLSVAACSLVMILGSLVFPDRPRESA